jgi:ABC-type multidrug transport system ATPase subunit
MELMAGRKTDGMVVGNIKSGSNNVAYVTSADVNIGDFTVRQSLLYAARLRMGDNSSMAECRERYISVAEAVGLESALDNVIGSELYLGITLGQKRRLSIATELLALPAVLCCDEPTTGKLCESCTITSTIASSIAPPLWVRLTW